MKREFKLLSVSKVGPKGQVVIPAEAREELGLKPGETVVVAGLSHHKAILIVDAESFEQHLGQAQRYSDIAGEYQKLKSRSKKETTG
ncbi:MAG: AbrB/MazE/SpoVT family DNA-binding domain-containing protein [Candidatus Nomurabacteria bacterium]|jgi:AbrB family looped-hinge helix DNA binding protein|nr:AbrB/MazE/SpoVT family DNA-binding domain-containing protein [Candidatus Nomurabacteria bacterium]